MNASRFRWGEITFVRTKISAECFLHRWTRLSNSNWAISAYEPPQAVWQKLKRYIDPDEYLVMLPLEEPSSWNSQDHAAVKWLPMRPKAADDAAALTEITVIAICS
jgi:hypothetical protein